MSLGGDFVWWDSGALGGWVGLGFGGSWVLLCGVGLF